MSEEIALFKYIPAGGPVTLRSAVEPQMPSVLLGRKKVRAAGSLLLQASHFTAFPDMLRLSLICYLQNKDLSVNKNLDVCCTPKILHNSRNQSQAWWCGQSKRNVYMIKMQVKNVVSPQGAEILKGGNLWIPGIGVAALACR